MVNVYTFYKERIFPKIKSFRGTTFLKEKLLDFQLRNVEKISESSESIFGADWDNLIILDACRHDIFEEVIEGSEYRITKGSSSVDFFRENFSHADYQDTVYISANPHIHESEFLDLTGKQASEVFHSVYHTYETDWDEESSTILPKSVERDAINADKLFSDKNKIIHFMQPHYPFLESDFDSSGIRTVKGNLDEENIWELCEKDLVEVDEVIDAYKTNLEIVWDSVERLSNELSGKTVVTADHGNLLGEGGIYGHPPGRREVGLRKVPWYFIEEQN